MGLTKYKEIANDIRSKILKGIYKENEQLPFEKELCEKYHASKMTVKKALDLLVAEGLIVKKRGSGTFVKDIQTQEMQRMMLSNQFRGFTATYADRKVSSIVLDFSVISAPERVATYLNIQKDSFVYAIRRVRCVDDQPLVIESMYMPIHVITGLKKEHLEASVYKYIEEDLGLKIQSAHRTIRVRKSTAEEQRHLHMQEHDPVAEVEQVAFLDNGQAFEYSLSVHRYDAFEFKTVILR
jgi:GntR family transcriptional regulator